MYRYVRNQPPDFSAQGLVIQHEGLCYSPCILHTAVGQDRSIGTLETFREHSHNLYHIVIFTKGEGAFSMEGEIIEAGPGTVVCMSPGVSHDFVTHRHHAVYSEVTFSFETPQKDILAIPFPELLQHYTGLPLQIEAWHNISPSSIQQLEVCIIDITDHARSGNPTATFGCQRSLARLFDCIIWDNIHQSLPATNTDDRLIKVKQYIDQHYCDPISADELATLANMSRGYLFRAYKKAYGQPPLAYQQQLRLEAAKTLLRSTALHCREVALRCGYDNIQFFHRLFKRTIGLTPGQYRKQSIETP